MALSGSMEVTALGVTSTFEAGFSGATARIIAAQEEFPEICIEELDRAANDAADILIDVWHGMSPVRTGEYAASLHKDVVEWGPERVDLEVWNDSDHSEYVEYGTGNAGRGYIYPYEASFFKFKDSRTGLWVRPRRSHGQRPQHVARNANAAARPSMMAQFRLATNRAHNRLKAIL